MLETPAQTSDLTTSHLEASEPKPSDLKVFDLTPEQQNTSILLQRLLGSAIADRYADFCRLAAGACDLRVGRPIAAHALRELDSLLRHVLQVPMDAKAAEDATTAAQIEKARQSLIEQEFDESAVQRATVALRPRLNHKTQIRTIVARLGLAPDGDIARCWIALSDSAGKAHQRSFHHALDVDDAFRSRYQQPLDTVIQAVAVALQGRYVALMRRVEELAALPNRSEAVSLFASEIPGALPLQWHFFERLQTGDWLPHLAREHLLGEPLAGSQSGNGDAMRFRTWPAGHYLLRMAASDDLVTRKGVADVLRSVAPSLHPDVHENGLEILAALPADEAAELSDLAVGCLSRESRSFFLQAPEALLKKLAEAAQNNAALTVARALLQIWDNNGQIASLYGHHMYEHHLPSMVVPLAKACGEDALVLFVELLQQAIIITDRDAWGHYSSHPVASDEQARDDIYDALVSAVRRAAETIVADHPGKMRGVNAVLTARSSTVFTRIALHVLAQDPAVAPELAETCLLDPTLIEASWAQDEYASLALAWFPALSRDQQERILAVIDAIPNKYRDAWKARFEENTKAPPTAENERIFDASAFRDAVWRWRAVLPSQRQDALNKVVAELGDPDAWKHRMFPEEVSPLSGADFTSRSVPDIVAFLKSWHPEAGPQRQTVTALAQELRSAVGNDSKAYAENADRLIGLKPIYIRRALEGLQNAANNAQSLAWGNVIRLIEHVVGQIHQTIDLATVTDGDDKDWSWACKAACETLASGLRRGATGVGFEHAAAVRQLVLSIANSAPKQPDSSDFEQRFAKEPFFAAQGSLRGLAVELCILLMFWLSKDPSSTFGTSPRQTLAQLPEIRSVLEAELADRSPNGRIPYAIMGSYLRYLLFFGADWLKPRMRTLFPAADHALRQSAWYSYLGFGRGPLMDLMPDLQSCYAEEIAGSATPDGQSDRDFRRDRLCQHLINLHLWGGLPNELLEQFWRDAPIGMRRYAMWYLGTQLDLPNASLPDESRARGLSYWERRLAIAMAASDPEPFRFELGALGQWCGRRQIDDHWLLMQLTTMLRAGFVPTDVFSVVDRLHKISAHDPDRAIAVLSGLLRHPRVERSAYVTQREAIRAMLGAGLGSEHADINALAEELIGFLSTIGETSYIDLIRPTAGQR